MYVCMYIYLSKPIEPVKSPTFGSKRPINEQSVKIHGTFYF